MGIACTGALLAIYLFAHGYCVTFLDGVATDRTEFCIGDPLTLICNGTAETYSWDVGTFAMGANLAVSAGNTLTTFSDFTANFVSMSETSLSFTVQAQHNGTTAICRNFAIANTTFLSFLILVYGPPSAPIVTVAPNNELTSFNVGLSSTDPAIICINEYNVTLTDSAGGSSVATVPANTTSFDAATLFNTQLELCSLMYQLSVVASSGGGVATVNGEINFQVLPSLTIMQDDDNITVIVPDALQNCIVNATYYFQGESGTFNVDTDVLLLSMFNTDTCMDGMLRINPVILGEARATIGASIQLCEPATTVAVSTEVSPSSTEMISSTSASVSVTVGSLLTLLGVMVTSLVAML